MNEKDPNLQSDRSTRIFGIIPAAGVSKRMGQPKLLLPWKSATVLDAVLATWKASNAETAIVVGGELSAQYRPIVVRHGAVLIEPDPRPMEMLESIQAALRWCAKHLAPRASDAWMVSPADQPSISKELINRLIDEFRMTCGSALVPVSGDHRGHPVLFPWSAADLAMKLSTGNTLRDLLAQFPPREVDWNDASQWQDIDTPDAYQTLRRQSERQ